MGVRSDLTDNNIKNPLFSTALRIKPELLTITADQTIAEGGPMILGFDPTNTLRNITLYVPAVTSYITYQKIIHFGTGTGQLVIKNAAAAVIGTLDPGASADLFYINGGWQVFIDQGAVAARNNSFKSIIPLYTTLASLANTNVLAVAVPFNFTLSTVGFRTKVPATTAAKAATATAQVNGVSVTGGVVSLTSANTTPTGNAVAGSAITAGGAGTAGQTVGVLISAVTAFLEGDGYFEFGVTQSTAP